MKFCTLNHYKIGNQNSSIDILLNNRCTFILVDIQPSIPTPCTPSPCGANAVCRVQQNAGSCTCSIDYIGNPYEGCRPECTLNSDCPSNQACIGLKCKDPCPGTCGQNAQCYVINHAPTCTCFERYTGNPFIFCNLIVEARKRLLILSLRHVSGSIIRLTLTFLQRLYQIMSIPAGHLPADHIVNAERATAKLFARAFQLT